MTENDWLCSTQPSRMYAWLSRQHRAHQEPYYWPSVRKMRLFGVACMRECIDVRRDLADEHEREGPAIPDEHWFRNWCRDDMTLSAATRSDLLRHILGNPWRDPLLAEVACCPICMGEGGWVASDGEATEHYKCHRCSGGGLRKTRANLSRSAVEMAKAVYEGERETGPLHDALIECGLDELAEHFNPTTQECPRCGGGGEYDDVGHEDLDGYGGIAVVVRCERCVGGRVPMVQEYNDGGVSYWFNLLEPNRRHLTPERAMPAHPRGCWALDLILGKR